MSTMPSTPSNAIMTRVLFSVHSSLPLNIGYRYVSDQIRPSTPTLHNSSSLVRNPSGTEAKCKDYQTSSTILLSDIIFRDDHQTTESDQPTEHSQADANNEVDQPEQQPKSEVECQHSEESDVTEVEEEQQGGGGEEEEGVAQFSHVADEEFTSHADDTCTLLFSSGTTGVSKAVELCHRNFMSAIAAYNALEPGASTSDMDVCLAIIPMYHVYGLGIVMLATLERGACVVTMERYSLPSMLQYVEKYKISVATLVPPILVQLVKSGDVVAKYDLSSLKIIATGNFSNKTPST